MRRANATDFEQLTDFYRYVAEHTKDMERYGRWVYGQVGDGGVYQSGRKGREKVCKA